MIRTDFSKLFNSCWLSKNYFSRDLEIISIHYGKILRFPRYYITVFEQPRNKNDNNGPGFSAPTLQRLINTSFNFLPKNSGRRCIFPETLKIRPKTFCCPFYRRMQFLWIRWILMFCARFFVVDISYKCFLYLANSGRRYIL